jgi:hypothetical protein
MNQHRLQIKIVKQTLTQMITQQPTNVDSKHKYNHHDKGHSLTNRSISNTHRFWSFSIEKLQKTKRIRSFSIEK